MSKAKKTPAAGKPAAQQWQTTAREKIKALGVNEAYVAERVGVSRPALNHWLNGRRQPSPEELSKIAAILGLTVGEMFTGSKTVVTAAAKGSIGRQARISVVTVIQCEVGGRWTRKAMQEAKERGGVTAPSTDPDAYAVVIEGDGLKPIARNGWLIVVEPNTPPVVGEYAWIETAAGEWMVRELIAADGESMAFSEVSGAPGTLTLPVPAMSLCCACFPLPPSKFIPG